MEYKNNKGGFKPNNQHGKRFSKVYQPVRNGRKKSVFKLFKTQLGLIPEDLSKEDYIKIIRSIMQLTPFQVKHLAGLDKKGENGKVSIDNADYPAWIVNIATALLSDMRYGRTRTIFYLFDSMFGSPSTVIDARTTNINVQNNINLSALTDEELTQYDKYLDKMLNKEPRFSPDYLTD